MATQARKIALISVHDYPKDKYDAYWEIRVDGNDEDGYGYGVRLLAYSSVAWIYEGKKTTERPDVPMPAYPPAPEKTNDHSKNVANAKEYRGICALIHEKCPVPVHLVDETEGETDTRDEADTAAQQWRSEEHTSELQSH